MKNKLIAEKVQKFILYIYLGIMLGFFPIAYHFQYRDMGEFKYHIFLYGTAVFLVLALLQLFFSSIAKVHICNKGKFTILDWTVVGFFISNSLSFVFSVNQKESFWGSPGWYMGFLTHLLLVGIYFAISRTIVVKEEKFIFAVLLLSSFIVYSLAVLHRFNIDPLNIYGNLPEKYRIEFLSTIGQSSWYSSFLSTVWPLGFYLFFVEKKKTRRVIYGIYTSVAAMSLVSQNTDTAFLSLSAVLLLLFFLSQKKNGGINRFLESIVLIFGSFSLMGMIQRIASDSVVPLERLSLFFSQGYISPVIIIMALLIYIVINRDQMGKVNYLKDFLESRKLFRAIVSIVFIVIVAVVLFIVLNTNGYLLRHFGFQTNNSYFLFNEKWGNLRGFSWRFSWDYFRELSPLRKIIGVGPDCYSVYYQQIPELYKRVDQFFGGLTLTNSHNEYFSKLINIGILGLVSYITMLLLAVKQFLKGERDQEILGTFALITVSYMVHAFFCYEQVCCTPIFFILIAIGNKIFYNEINIRK